LFSAAEGGTEPTGPETAPHIALRHLSCTKPSSIPRSEAAECLKRPCLAAKCTISLTSAGLQPRRASRRGQTRSKLLLLDNGPIESDPVGPAVHKQIWRSDVQILITNYSRNVRVACPAPTRSAIEPSCIPGQTQWVSDCCATGGGEPVAMYELTAANLKSTLLTAREDCRVDPKY